MTTETVEYPGAGRMCYPGAVQRAAHHHANVEVNRFRKSSCWSPISLVKTINKSILDNGRDISRKIVKVTGKAKNKGSVECSQHMQLLITEYLSIAVTVKRWVFDLNFSKVILPLCLLAFITLLHPHTEIQVCVEYPRFDICGQESIILFRLVP